MSKKKSKRIECGITRHQFEEAARPIVLVAQGDGVRITVPVRDFSTGSFGWYGSTKVGVLVGGKNVLVQLSVTGVVLGSKDLPPDGEEEQ